MTRQLPDVNLLFALIWPRHKSHSAAHLWFRRSGHRAWATNILTQLGVLRLLTNPAVTQGAVSATAALDLMSELTQHTGHEFWPFAGSFSDRMRTIAARVQGHQQWTDLTLLAQAAARNSVLVTFDTGIKTVGGRDLSAHLLVLKDA